MLISEILAVLFIGGVLGIGLCWGYIRQLERANKNLFSAHLQAREQWVLWEQECRKLQADFVTLMCASESTEEWPREIEVGQ